MDEMSATYLPFLQKMSKTFNSSNLTLENIWELYDTINSDIYLGRRLPANFTEDDYNNLEHLRNWAFEVASGGKVSGMLNTLSLTKVLSTFDTRTKLPKSYFPKMSFFFEHDTNLLCKYLTLNMSSSDCI